MPILRALLPFAAGLALIAGGAPAPAGPLVQPVQANAPDAAHDLDATISALEAALAQIAAADDAALGDAVVGAIRAMATAAGDPCRVGIEALDEEDEVRAMVGYILHNLGFAGEVTPDIATLFTSSKRIRTMVNTLKDRAGSLPDTAGYLVRLDAVKEKSEALDARIETVMRQIGDDGRLKTEGFTLVVTGEGCPVAAE